MHTLQRLFLAGLLLCSLFVPLQAAQDPASWVGRTVLIWTESSDRYLGVSDSGNRLLGAGVAERDRAARFIVERAANDRFALRHVASGKFVRAGIGQGSLLGAASDRLAAWETFDFVPQTEDRMALRSTQNGRFVRAGVGSKSNLGASSERASDWEMFRIYPATTPTGPRTIASDGRFCQQGHCFDLERFGDHLTRALAGQSIVKHGFVLRRGTASVQQASGPKRTAADAPASNFTVHDRFNPASVSKTVTSVATLQLLARRGLSIDTPIHRYLPPDWNIPAANREITFKQVLNHTSGLRNEGMGRGEYDSLRTVMERAIHSADKVESYQNVNYALLRILVASLDRYKRWHNDPGPNTASRFISYVNREIFSPIGIANVRYAPDTRAPTLFYSFPPGNARGTTYGDWTQRPGSAGTHMSTHEAALFGAAAFGGTLLSDAMVASLKDHELGFNNYGAGPDQATCWGKGGFFPGERNGGAELSSVIVHCDSGVTAMLVINGQVNAWDVMKPAYLDAFVRQVP
jgi:CubicO group peptidase (beta-lactamase class C family)